MTYSFIPHIRLLVDDAGRIADIKDKAILKRLMDIEAMETEDKKPLCRLIDSLLRDAKVRKTYAAQELFFHPRECYATKQDPNR